MTSVFSWENSISLCPASFCTPRPDLPVTPGIEKGVRQGCILSPCLFHFYAEYNMQSAGMDEYKLESRFPGEISITSDNADGTTLMAEREEELKSLLRRVKKLA